MKSSLNTSAFNKRSRIFAFLFLLLTGSAVHSYAQSSLQLGIKAGGNLMKIGGRSFDGKHYPGFSAGVYGKLNFTSKWSLQPELNWNQVIAHTGENFNQIYGGLQSQVNLNYVAVPILVVYKPIPELSLMIGPQYGFLVSQTQGLLPPQQHVDNAFNKNDISLVFGGQLNLNKVILGLRYQIGENNIGYRSTDTWRQYGLQFYIGYQLKDLKLK